MNLLKEHRLSLTGRTPKKREKRDLPDHVLQTCPGCQTSQLASLIRSNLGVCPRCSKHLPIGARQRIDQIADPGSFRETEARIGTRNACCFEGYDEKLESSRKKTGLKEAFLSGTCRIEGIPAAVGVMDSGFMMASMVMAVGEKICRLIQLAQRKKLPLILFCASGGARMQEGMLSLIQMARTNALLEEFSQEKGLYISVLTHPTTGGVSASFAMAADVLLAEPDALIGFAGRRVIEKTIHEKLPDSFQKAESLLESGFLDAICDRRELKKTLAMLLRMHGYEAA